MGWSFRAPVSRRFLFMMSASTVNSTNKHPPPLFLPALPTGEGFLGLSPVSTRRAVAAATRPARPGSCPGP